MSTETSCPDVKGFVLSGSAWFEFEIALDCWIARLEFAGVTLGFKAGLDVLHTRTCHWYSGDGWRRRRYWSPRRRNRRYCTAKKVCDLFVKGYIQITVLIFKAQLEFVYWTSKKVLEILVKLHAWAWKWYQVFHHCIYERHFGDGREQLATRDAMQGPHNGGGYNGNTNGPGSRYAKRSGRAGYGGM